MAVNGGTPIPEEALKVMKEKPTYEQVIISDPNTNKTVGATTWSEIGNHDGTGSPQEGDMVYRNIATGGWTTNIQDATGIVKDEKTGKVTIKAPKSVLESPWLKEQFMNDNTFKSLITAYSEDPTSTTPLPYTDKDGNQQTATVSELIDKYNDAMKDYAKTEQQLLKERNRISDETTSKMKISDEAAIIYNSVSTRDKNRYSNDVAVHLPKIALKEKYGLTKLPSFNATAQTVSAKDFYDWYNLDDGTEGKDNLVLELTDAVGDTVANWQNWKGKSEADTEDFDEDAAGMDYARAASFYKTLHSDNPEANVLTTTRLMAQSALNSFTANIVKSAFNITSAWPTFGEFLDKVDDTVYPLKVITSPIKMVGDTVRLMADGMYMAGSAISGTGIDVNVDMDNLGAAEIIGVIGKDLFDGDLSGTVDIYEKLFNLKDKASIDKARKTINEIDLKNNSDLTRLSSAATFGSIVGGLAAEVLKQIYLTNKIGKGAEGVAKATEVAEAAGTLGRAGTTMVMLGDNVEDLVFGTKLLAAALKGKQMSGALKVAGVTGNLVAQGISDTILNDQELLEKMFREGDTSGAIAALEMNTVFNAAGELTGLATTKGWEVIKNTRPGQVVEAWGQRVINRGAAVKHEALYKLADKINSWKKNGPAGESFYTFYHKAQANASRNIGKAAKKAAITGETVTKETQNAVMAKIRLERGFTRIATQTGRTVMEFQADPHISKYFKKLEDSSAKVVEAENYSGIKAGEKTLFSQDTTNYIVRKNRLNYLANKGGEDLAALGGAEKRQYEALSKLVKDYETTASEELVNAANAYMKDLETYYFKFNNYLAKEGIIDKEWLQSLRDTGYWGENGDQWIFAKATDNGLKGAEKVVSQVSDGENFQARIENEQYHYKTGEEEVNYLDPQLTVLSHQIGMAKIIDSREWGNALIETQALAKEIDTNGKALTSKELTTIRRQVNTVASKSFNNFRSFGDILKYHFADFYKEVENIPGKIEAKERKIEKILKLDSDRKLSIASDLDSASISTLKKRLKSIPDYGIISTKAEFDEFYNGLSANQKRMVEQAMGTKEVTRGNYNNAIRTSDLADKLTRSYISENPKIMESKAFENVAIKVRKTQLTARQATTLKESYDKIREMQKVAGLKEIGEDQFTLAINEFTNAVVKDMEGMLANNKFFAEMLKKYTDAGIKESDAVRYLLLDNLDDAMTRSNSSFSRAIERNLDDLSISDNLTTRQKTRYTKAIKDAFGKNVKSELSLAANALKENGGLELLNTKKIFDETYELMDDIIKNQIQDPNVIRVLDKNGTYKFYEVSPITAELYNTRPNFSDLKTGVVAKLFNKSNRIFRISTTGWGLSSFENQWLRDPLNAYVMGGMTRTLSQNIEELGQILGPDAVYNLKESYASTSEKVAEGIRKEAEALYDGASPETKYYRELAGARKETLFGDYEQEVGKIEKALRFAEEHSPGNFREVYLRKAVYAQSVKDSLLAGKTMKEAKMIAEVVADNATTDFSRMFAWGNKLTHSIPYLGAAINGKASFWRLLEIDPIGISGRFFSGIVLPMMSMTARSLSTEENRKIYLNIPEYYKKDNLVFVANGNPYKIPIPQELSMFVSPIRHAVEKMSDANNNSWGELLLNDMLDIPVVSLAALADLDDPLGKDADFFSRIGHLGQSLVSTLSPPAVKTAYMMATGIDPYTGAEIDKSKQYRDDEGNLQVMDSEDNALAQFVSSTCKFFGIDVSPSSAEAYLSSFFGQAGVDFFGSLGRIFSGDPVGAAGVYGKNAAKPFSVYAYDKVDRAWKEEVKMLQAKKAALLADDPNNPGDLASINQKLQQARNQGDDAKVKKLSAEYRQAVQGYRDEVFNAVKKFNSINGANYDWKKFTSVLNLLNFYSTSQDITGAAYSADAQKMYFDAQDVAKQTMVDMGFNGTNDWSIFGYFKTDEYGNTEYKAMSPVAIMNMDGIFYRGRNETLAKIDDVVKNEKLGGGKSLKDQKKDMETRVSSLYAAKKYDEVDKVYKAWDEKVMQIIYPILAENDLMDDYGNSLLDSKEVIDLLDDYIKVPSDAMGKGKYYSSKTGLNKQRGFAPKYIKKIFEKLKEGEK